MNINNTLFDTFYKLNVKGQSIDLFIGPDIENKAIFFDNSGRYLGIVKNTTWFNSGVGAPIKKFSMDNIEIKQDEMYKKIKMEILTTSPENFQVNDVLFDDNGKLFGQIAQNETGDALQPHIGFVRDYITNEKNKLYKLMNNTKFTGGFYIYEIDPTQHMLTSTHNSKITGIVLQRIFDTVSNNLNHKICAYFKFTNGLYSTADEPAIHDFMNSNNKYFTGPNIKIAMPEEYTILYR